MRLDATLLRRLLPLLVLTAGGARAEEAQPTFEQCLTGLARLAEARGVPAATARDALKDLAPDPAVLPATKTQAEFVRPVWDYIDAAVTPEKIATGQAKLAEWAEVLGRIEAANGVDRHILVAFWGVESGYGSVLDDPKIVRPVIPALATLACQDGSRAGFWRDELLGALTILGNGDADATPRACRPGRCHGPHPVHAERLPEEHAVRWHGATASATSGVRSPTRSPRPPIF